MKFLTTVSAVMTACVFVAVLNHFFGGETPSFSIRFIATDGVSGSVSWWEESTAHTPLGCLEDAKQRAAKSVIVISSFSCVGDN